MDEKSPNGPVEVELKVHVIEEAGGRKARRGVATISMGFGRFPTPAAVQERIDKFAKEEIAGMAPGYRLQTAPEFWDTACHEKTGQFFAVPGSYHEFDRID